MYLRYLLIAIFLLAVFIRFLYFPDNTYFGFDQARDAFASQQVINGDLKIIGPPTAISGVHHGPLYYYLFGPVYLLSQGDPATVSAFLRIYNSFGVILVFLIANVLFNKYVGVMAGLIFAVSFEQSQFALYLNHPSLAVNSVLLFYLGFAKLIFRKKDFGIFLVALGLGLSIQFELPLIYLAPIAGLILLIFKKEFKTLNLNKLVKALLLLFAILSTFILAEFKYNFQTSQTLISDVLFKSSSSQQPNYLNNISIISQRYLSDNLLNLQNYWQLIYLILLFALSYIFLYKKEFKKQALFLTIWFIGGFIPYLNNTAHLPLYYYGISASVSLIIFVSFLIHQSFKKYKFLAIAMILCISISNLDLITKNNSNGSISTINVQSKMILGDQKDAIDYIYQEAGNEPFSINALTMPLYINTVWSYLFEWYGQKQYGYLPVWGGEKAAGYYGNLAHQSNRSALPEKKFLIIEPTRGVEKYIIDDFIKQEDIFTSISKEKRFGDIIVQSRSTK